MPVLMWMMMGGADAAIASDFITTIAVRLSLWNRNDPTMISMVQLVVHVDIKLRRSPYHTRLSALGCRGAVGRPPSFFPLMCYLIPTYVPILQLHSTGPAPPRPAPNPQRLSLVASCKLQLLPSSIFLQGSFSITLERILLHGILMEWLRYP